MPPSLYAVLLEELYITRRIKVNFICERKSSVISGLKLVLP